MNTLQREMLSKVAADKSLDYLRGYLAGLREAVDSRKERDEQANADDNRAMELIDEFIRERESDD